MSSSYFFLKILSEKRNKLFKTNGVELDENSLKTNIIKNQCRICLKQGSVPIFASDSTDTSEAVEYFGNIKINACDEFPKLLCDACYSLLQGAILFRKTAKESDMKLRNKIKHSILFPSETKIEDTVNDDHSDYNKYEDNINYLLHKCKLCKLDFNSYDEYLTHVNSKQHRNVRVQCRICHGLLTSQLYQKHLARHQSASHLVCDVCGKLYRKDNLVRHLQLHSYDLPFQCQICPYRGRFMESLKIHMRTHSGDKPFSCEKCDLKFLTRSNLNRHILTHKKERPYKCKECNRSFYTQRDVDVHFKSDHAGIKDFSCLICGNKYGTRKALMRHELRVHKRDKMAKGRMPLYLQSDFRKQKS